MWCSQKAHHATPWWAFAYWRIREFIPQSGLARGPNCDFLTAACPRGEPRRMSTCPIHNVEMVTGGCACYEYQCSHCGYPIPEPSDQGPVCQRFCPDCIGRGMTLLQSFRRVSKPNIYSYCEICGQDTMPGLGPVVVSEEQHR